MDMKPEIGEMRLLSTVFIIQAGEEEITQDTLVTETAGKNPKWAVPRSPGGIRLEP